MPSYGPLTEYYEQRYVEQDRLGRREGQIEFVRTQELLRRYLPAAPAKIMDIGGGTGPYAAWLASLGYDVQLVDIVPAHVQAASRHGTFAAMVGDACALPVLDAGYDAVLLFGPLYHLLDPQARLAALTEAYRIVKPGGLVIAAFISRGAVALDGYVKGWIDQPGMIRAVREHLQQGVSLAYGSGFGAIACFHLPSEAHAELTAAGLDVLAVLGVEGPGWIAPDFNDRWLQTEKRELLLESARICEEMGELRVLSAHLLGIARRP